MQHISYPLRRRLTKLALEIYIHVISAWRSPFSLFDPSGLKDCTVRVSAGTLNFLYFHILVSYKDISG